MIKSNLKYTVKIWEDINEQIHSKNFKYKIIILVIVVLYVSILLCIMIMLNFQDRTWSLQLKEWSLTKVVQLMSHSLTFKMKKVWLKNSYVTFSTWSWVCFPLTCLKSGPRDENQTQIITFKNGLLQHFWMPMWPVRAEVRSAIFKQMEDTLT